MKCFYRKTEHVSLYSFFVENHGSCLVVLHGMGYENVENLRVYSVKSC